MLGSQGSGQSSVLEVRRRRLVSIHCLIASAKNRWSLFLASRLWHCYTQASGMLFWKSVKSPLTFMDR